MRTGTGSRAPCKGKIGMQTKKTTTGLVLRATKTGEADRVLLLLTPDGLVSAMAKGALRMRSKLFSGTGLFCYSEFVLFEGKTMFVVDAASVKQVFWGLREDVERMALAMYCAELASTLSPTGDEAKAQLRLLLNSLYFLSEGKRPPRQLKALYELRAMTLAGFMPDLVACADCVKYEGGAFCFDAMRGRLFCADCAAKRELSCNLDAAALAAMRYIVFSEDEKLFSFSVSEQTAVRLGAVTQQWTLVCLNRPLRSLEFLQTIWDAPTAAQKGAEKEPGEAARESAGNGADAAAQTAAQAARASERPDTAARENAGASPAESKAADEAMQANAGIGPNEI